jgi:hypothetical protein
MNEGEMKIVIRWLDTKKHPTLLQGVKEDVEKMVKDYFSLSLE